MRTEEIRYAAVHDDHIDVLSTYVMYGWPSTRAEVIKEVQPYWSFRDELAVIDGITMKGIKIIMLAFLEKWGLDQLHVNHMFIEKTAY